MKIIFALVAALPLLTAVLGAPLQEQGLVKRHIFNYVPDLSVAARETESPQKEIRRSVHEGRNVDFQFKRHEESPDAGIRRKRHDESPDTEVRRKRHDDGGLAIEVKRHDEGGLAIEVKRHDEGGLAIEVKREDIMGEA